MLVVIERQGGLIQCLASSRDRRAGLIECATRSRAAEDKSSAPVVELIAGERSSVLVVQLSAEDESSDQVSSRASSGG